LLLYDREFDHFLSILQDELHHKKEELPHKQTRTWDVRVRELFFKTTIGILKESYVMTVDIAKKHVFVEKHNPLPRDKGKKGGKIFGSNLYPDAIIVTDDGHKIAIELDHGNKGSQIKDTLAKKAMLKRVGGFDRVIVFFFWYAKMNVMDIVDKLERSNGILRKESLHKYLLHLEFLRIQC